MARPKFSEPKTPEMKSPVPEISQNICGTSWNEHVKIRVPFQNIDQYEVRLPPFGDMGIMPDPMSDPDFIRTVGAAHKSIEDGSVSAFIDAAKEILEGYNSDGFIDPKNYGTINALIKRAATYLGNAKQLWAWWEIDYSTPNSYMIVDGWPLDKEDIFEDMVPTVSSSCDFRRAPDTVDHTVWNPALEGGRGGHDIVKIGCPSVDAVNNHGDDRKLFCKLVLAAVVNARCAQEAASAVGVYNRNKKRTSGLGIKAAEREIGGFVARPKKEWAPGLINPTEAVPPEEPPPEPKPKKKDNTMLIVGAAALGILAISRK